MLENYHLSVAYEILSVIDRLSHVSVDHAARLTGKMFWQTWEN